MERAFDPLAADRDNTRPMIDSTIVRVHQQAVAEKRLLRSGVGAFATHHDRRTIQFAGLAHLAAAII